jgi:hypothetical protein
MNATVEIFLSYAQEDKDEVENLYQRLSNAGFKPWMDKKDILPGERWKSSIHRAVQSSDFFLVCLSVNSVNKRGFLQKEIKDALDIWQEKLESDIYLIPVRLEDCETPETLGDFQWVNLFEEDGWARLVQAIRVGMKRRGEAVKPITQKPIPHVSVQTADMASERRALQQYLSTLRQILVSRFSEEELQTLCFDLGIDYDDLPAQGRAGKARALIAHLGHRDRVRELVAIGQRLRPDISWQDAPKSTGEPSVNAEGISPGQLQPNSGAAQAGNLPFNLEFANRKDELQTVLKPIHNPGAPRYLEICAPAGYGKTYLVNKAVEEYRRAGWLCVSIDFLKEEDLRTNQTLLLLEIGDQLGIRRRLATSKGLAWHVMGKRQQSVIFLDAVELAHSEVRRWIKVELIPVLEERVANPRFKPYVIGASKYSIPEWRVYSRQRFKTLKLTPFTENVVDRILRDVAEAAGQHLEDSYFSEMVKTILLMSKGHPRCIGEILRAINEENFTLPAADLMCPEMLDRVIGSVVEDEILAGVRDELKPTLKMLCVLRGYAPNILDRLEASGIIPRREYFDWDLEDELLSTHLVDPPNGSSLYCFEPLIRQIIALYQQTKAPRTFWRLNDLALEVYEEQITGVDVQGKPLPRPVSDRSQVACIVEALFHFAQHLSQQGLDREGVKQQLLQALDRYRASWRTRQNKRFWADLLLNMLDHDDELKDLVYELADDYDFLLKPVRQVREAVTKEK